VVKLKILFFHYHMNDLRYKVKIQKIHIRVIENIVIEQPYHCNHKCI